MRDPERTPRIMRQIETLWKRNPDWRLTQLIFNVLRDRTFWEKPDLFHCEDDLLEIAVGLELKSTETPPE